MDKSQHSVQDSCEAYAVFVMQRTAEELSVSASTRSAELATQFLDYLYGCGLTEVEFESGIYGQYKKNVDAQVPEFVKRLSEQSPEERFDFENVERDARNNGLKADVEIRFTDRTTPLALSIKNYIGAGGITRPQVSSGTFLSFASGFVFDRIGVGTYLDTRPDAVNPTFRGSDKPARDAVLAEAGRMQFSPLLDHLDDLQAEMRQDLLAPDAEIYDKGRVRAAVERCAVPGIATTLQIFELLGSATVREKFLARAGLDGKEEALFFDENRYVDSITNQRYHNLRASLNATTTTFSAEANKQSIRFRFSDTSNKRLLATDVPFTINTNGAWFRPKERFEGTQTYSDKGHDVLLHWGQRRPYKSREIATSTNTYVNLASTGIFG